MYKVWAVVKRELLELAKRPIAFAWTLALPLIMIVFLGNILNFSGSSSGKLEIKLPTVVQDDGPGTQQFLAQLEGVNGVSLTIEKTNLDDAKDHVQTKSDRGAYLVIPPGFSQAYLNHQSTTLQVVSTGDSSSGQVVRQILESVADRYNTTAMLTTAAQQQAQQSGQSFDQATAAQRAQQIMNTAQPLLKIDAQSATGATFNQFDQIAPGYATMFVIFGLQTVVLTIIADRTKGTMRRLAVMPLPRWAYMTGKMTAQFIISFFQVSIMLAVAKFFFKANINADNFLGIFLMVVTLSFAATALGMLLVSVFKSDKAVQPAITLVALIGSMVGGAFFPLWLMPSWIQNVSKVFINSWAMSGFNDLMIFKQSLAHVLPNILALMAYGLICLALATRFFRYSDA